MDPICFATPWLPQGTFSTKLKQVCAHRRRMVRRRLSPRMQLPPPGAHSEPPLTEAERGPPGYEWDPDYPGTLKPGKCPDNFPLEEVLASGVYENMEYEEYDRWEVRNHVFPLDEDLLEWLAKQGRLMPRDMTDDEFDAEVDKQISGITEEDLEFAEDDDKMLAYYSKQGEGSSEGSSSDFGGFSESFAESGEGFGV